LRVIGGLKPSLPPEPYELVSLLTIIDETVEKKKKGSFFLFAKSRKRLRKHKSVPIRKKKKEKKRGIRRKGAKSCCLKRGSFSDAGDGGCGAVRIEDLQGEKKVTVGLKGGGSGAELQ